MLNIGNGSVLVVDIDRSVQLKSLNDSFCSFLFALLKSTNAAFEW